MARFVQLTVSLALGDAELAADLLHECGALGLEVRDGAVPAMPGVAVPPPGQALLVASYEGAATAMAPHDAVCEAFPQATAALEDVPDTDWSTAWRARIRAVETPRVWVGPPWLAATAPEGKRAIVIEPKMAFGTGDHPTTLLCLEAVDAFMAHHPGASVLDVGTGTGVLALAAKKLGAARVVGVDNDAVSVALAKENASLNGAPALDLSARSLEQIPGTFDLVVANILANTLVDLGPSLAPKVGHALILAGVLTGQDDEVARAYTAHGLVRGPGTHSGEWIRLDFTRP